MKDHQEELIKVLKACLEILEGEYPKDQWEEFYHPIIDAQNLLKKIEEEN